MRIVWTLLILTLLAFGASQLLLRNQPGGHQNTVVLPVPPDDIEFAWIHTSTNVATWERFVLGVQRLAGDGWVIDDSRALLEETTSIPEITITRADETRKVRVRWYKLSSETGSSSQWIKALSLRNPAPLAIIGGGSSDRAFHLVKSLSEQKSWKGSPPLLFLTTATADEIKTGEDKYEKLMSFYPDRTFRFCFSNSQMASAVIDFVDQTDLRPTGNFPPLQRALLSIGQTDPLSSAATLGLILAPFGAPHRFAVWWQDDPYSINLLDKFEEVIRSYRDPASAFEGRPLIRERIPFSVGTFDHANPAEEEAVRDLLQVMPTTAGERSLLILPTVAAPARRVLRELTGSAPMIGRHLVAVTGDAISFNTFYRDADFAWNVRDLPVPIVAFLHQNPVGWEEARPNVPALVGPSSTEDILLYQEMMERAMRAIFPKDKSVAVRTSEELRDRLRSIDPPFFDPEGNRLSGQNEFVVLFRPIFLEGDRIKDEPQIAIWSRSSEKNWKLIRLLSKYKGAGN